MIENLNGIHETVTFQENTNTRLYNNTDCEEYPIHWHTPMEIIMVEKNNYSVKCSEVTYHLEEGDIFLICPCVLHSLYATEGQRYIFQAELRSAVQLQELDSLLNRIAPCRLITSKNDPELYPKVRTLMEEITQCYSQKVFLWELSIFSKLLELLILVGEHQLNHIEGFHVGDRKEKEYVEKFTDICQYLHNHCTEELSLEQVAFISGFSKYHFARLFKQFAHVPFYKYVSLQRIAIAEQLLTNPQMSITDIALQCGFGSMSSFIRMFKLIKGHTPSAYRDMYLSPN